MADRYRPAWAEVDLGAIRHNASQLAALAPGSALCAVVKADGYGHGAVPVARAALDGGATWLAVALVEEAIALREAGIDAPILLLSEPPPTSFAAIVAHGITATIYSAEGTDALVSAARRAGRRAAAHVKLDTGMRRVGTTPEDALALARRLVDSGVVDFEALWTHFAVADEPHHDFTVRQLSRFDDAVERFERASLRPPMLHCANSAGTIAHPDSHRDMVRCGIALYGYDPVLWDAATADLRPALSLRSEVSWVKRVAAGEALSYGLRYTALQPTVVATVPLGYADGVPRRLSLTGAELLVGGQRRPLAGTVTMDQLLVDCGPDADVRRGDEVVLLGRQGDEAVTADEWAERLGTISYEVLCGIGPRVPRVHVG